MSYLRSSSVTEFLGRMKAYGINTGYISHDGGLYLFHVRRFSGLCCTLTTTGFKNQVKFTLAEIELDNDLFGP